jgi:hypothetical protein
MDALTAAANVAEDFPGGARALAVAIDRNPVTLSHELNGTGTAKLGLRTAIKMTIRSKDPRILNAFAAECGYMTLPLPETMMVDGDGAVQLVGQAMQEFNDVAQAFVKGAADGRWSGNEVGDLERQWGELVAAGQKMLQHARAAHEAAKPASLHAVTGTRG